MPKRKQPPKHSESEAVVERQPQEKTELVAFPPERLPPALIRALQAVRAAALAVLDLADAAAKAVTKGLPPRQ
jgi:hypothetical protein